MPLLLGSGLTGSTYLLGSGPDDDGTPVEALIETDRVAPAGLSGEVVGYLAYLTLTATASVSGRLTPIVDDVVYDGVHGPDARVGFTVTAPANSRRQQQHVVLGLSCPLLIDGIEMGRLGLRGTWFQFRVETLGSIGAPVDGLALGELLGEGVSVDFDTVGTTNPILAGI